MFYSHDLLGRKTPLGAIWTLAHGRKLSKGRIISINLREICDEILQPGVPHSLRLQGILIGGLVLVFNKQQTYLLEDLQEMMKRLKAATDTGGAAGDASKAEKGKGRGKGKGKQGTNNQARLEAITMMDMEDLMAPAAFGDDDILGLLAGGSLSEALASQGALPAGGNRRLAGGAELAGDLFEMPSLPGGATTSGATTSEGGDTDAQGRQQASSKHTVGGSKGSTRLTGGGHGQQRNQQEEEVYGGLDMMQQDWLHPEDEMFADPDADLDLLGGMDLPLLPPAAAGAGAAAASDRSRDQTTTTTSLSAGRSLSEQQQQTASDGGGAAGAHAAAHAGVDVPFEFDDQMFVLEDEDEDGQALLAGSGAQRDQRQQRDQAKKTAPTTAAQVRRAKQQRKRKGGQLVVDDLDNLVIRSKTYREWSTDSSPLINKDLQSGRVFRAALANTAAATGGAGAAAGAAPVMMHTTGFAAGLAAAPGAPFAYGAGSGVLGGVPLCPELVALFKAPVQAAAAHKATAAGAGKGRGKQQQQPSSPEVNNSTGEGSLLPGMLVHQAHKMPLDLHHPPDSDMMIMQDEDMHEVEQELQSNDEAHDRLADLPFNGDIEIERMRAAATPGSSDGSLQHLMPQAGGGAGGLLVSGGRDSNATSAGGSSLMGGRFRLGGGGGGGSSERGASGLKRRLGSADLGTKDDMDIFFGTGNLADMLPDVQADDFFDDMQQQQHADDDDNNADESTEGTGTGAAAATRRGSRRASAAAAGSGQPRSGSEPSLTPYTSSQFPLLEETEPDQLQATQLHSADQAALSKMTRVALSIFQDRLQGPTDDDGGDQEAATQEPSVSFFGLIKEGRLSRNQAATLFYQVCVTTTAGFVSASQDSAYGDITIKQGSRGGAVA